MVARSTGPVRADTATAPARGRGTPHILHTLSSFIKHANLSLKGREAEGALPPACPLSRPQWLSSAHPKPGKLLLRLPRGCRVQGSGPSSPAFPAHKQCWIRGGVGVMDQSPALGPRGHPALSWVASPCPPLGDNPEEEWHFHPHPHAMHQEVPSLGPVSPSASAVTC